MFVSEEVYLQADVYVQHSFQFQKKTLSYKQPQHNTERHAVNNYIKILSTVVKETKEHWFSTSQANGLFDVFPGGGTNGGEEDLTAFLCPYNISKSFLIIYYTIIKSPFKQPPVK